MNEVIAYTTPKETEKVPRSMKRPRVAIACQRCKRRKQITSLHKCNGLHPCLNCQDFGADCIYLPPRSMTIHRDYQQRSVQAVEDRVAELESIIRRERISDTRSKRKRRSRSDGLANALTPIESVESPAANQWKPSPAPSDSRSDIVSQNFSQQPRIDNGTMMNIERDPLTENPNDLLALSSQTTMNRVITSTIQGRKERVGSSKQPACEYLSPDSAITASYSLDDTITSPHISAGIAQRLLDCYAKHFAPRWPVLQTSLIHMFHAERDNISDAFFTSILHLVYAIAGRYLETAGETGSFFPELHLAEAMKNMDDILRFLWSTEGSVAWGYIGLAMRQCIDLGLHRKTRKLNSPLEEDEMRKMVFWTCYCLDRQISNSLGRSFAISDRDIDAEFPLDTYEITENLEALQKTYLDFKLSGSRVPTQSTSMTKFIHICKLRTLESHIQQSLYRVDQSSTATNREVDGFLQRLDNWKSHIPMGANSFYSYMVVDDQYDNYMLYYYKCLHFILQPFVVSDPSQVKLVRRCAEACGGVCRTYKKLHQGIPIGFSFLDLRSVFLAGMNLIYCVWASPKEVLSINASNDMNTCSIVLYIMTERFSSARKYRDVYETIKSMVLESIEGNYYEAKRSTLRLRSCIQAALQALSSDQDELGSFLAMMSDMAGEPATLDDGASASAPTGCRERVSPASAESNNGIPLDGIPLDFQKVDTYNAMDLELGTIFATPNSDWRARIGKPKAQC
ncbi:fungal-specific transcription factor domain-containing protein [Apiospora arundinis]|uniref:Fungal-specific transcription factor domain-containing protein n=1 Tax=Apiospora arundinis TaxID=335852 RepID=A0ABR2HLA2_9PEZI